MKIQSVDALDRKNGADALILPFFEKSKPAFAVKQTKALFKAPLECGDFSGKIGEVLCHYPGGHAKRVVLIGLGEETAVTQETLRRAFAKGLCTVKKNAKSLSVQLPKVKKLSASLVQEAVTEGILLANYTFDENKSEEDPYVESLEFIGGVCEESAEICQGVYLARNLVMHNADQITPQHLSKQAKDLSKEFPKIETKILGGPEVKSAKMGLLQAVNRGSDKDPAVIFMEYRGDPKSKEMIAVVGKGVTYDTGGLNLKPTGFMETMREDMAGSAAVFGTLRNVAALKLPINVLGVIGTTENSIGPESYKPGDVYTSYSGVKVEISNTDAEGRLVLADVISYAQKHYPLKNIIDLATLTGGAVVAFGEEASAIMGNDDKLIKDLIEVGNECYERVCPMPLFEEYEEMLKSKYADIKNSSTRKASAIQGGTFIKRFVEKNNWAHLDIAGTAYLETLKPYHPIQATGVGVRLITRYLQRVCKKHSVRKKK